MNGPVPGEPLFFFNKGLDFCRKIEYTKISVVAGRSAAW